MSKTANKKMTSAMWIMLQAAHKAETLGTFEPDVAERIMAATAVPGTRTEAEWDDMYGRAIEGECSMLDVYNFDQAPTE